MRNRIQASVEPDAPLFSFSARDAATAARRRLSARAAARLPPGSPQGYARKLWISRRPVHNCRRVPERGGCNVTSRGANCFAGKIV
ncbi:hypothetical protein C7S13_8774 [Burkholderia cepacia]|nr:hypothetical protein [Burkholderia cepacia]